jgi:alcohol dehydrogenase
MKALVYHGPGKKSLDERPKPELSAPGDAVVRVTRTTICGTDLHILKGDVPTCEPGRILGHEGVGVIEQAGPAVAAFKPGDHVLISCISSCGKCDACRRGMYSHCTTGGWILGNRIDGTQAEYMRLPHADTSLYPIPPGADEEALVMLSDILPTGFECGVLNGKVQPGSSVAIVGAGPIGLAALLTAQFYAPAQIVMIDRDENRLAVAKRVGATACVNIDTVNAADAVMKLWDRNIAITTRLVDTVSTPMLLKTVRAGRLDPTQLITHRFKLADVIDAYDTFGRGAQTQALKVVIEM